MNIKHCFRTKLFFLCILTIACVSCKSYRYYAPTPNAVLFKNKGEVQVSAELGTTGGIVKGGVAVSDNIGIMGLYQGAYSSGLYRVSEGEVGVGYYQFSKHPNRGLFLCAGTAFGSNFKYNDSTHTSKAYEGSFYRPFVQVNTGISNGEISGRFTGDVIFAFKASGLLYQGHHLDAARDPISSQYLLLEPALKFSLGSRVIHFDFSTGLVVHPTIEGLNAYSNARTFPLTVSFGMRFLINRKYSEETPVQP